MSTPNTPDASAAPEPVLLDDALAGFEALWSPHIVTRVNDYDVRVAKVAGAHVWHVHDTTDEFFLLLDGELDIALRDCRATGGVRAERTVHLARGAVFVVPKGVEHRPSSPRGASILLFEPTGTVSVGDRHDEIPDHVDATTGHALPRP
ncbi:cupin domain-containing protein [Streptomyces sp. 8L]|uniref:cupin domain-containing protein n=1 Tax=Streptomyces sp. 8L TaxID=2877242 RepID=UPI001CD3198D|nr:cupin domain-containing protein [Streptomyces sp. 8L]MCA1220786.1 cupin domain-containing protein [Streptomyces sp. 8L]